jgi:uncharacterized phage protein (TIGR01671 family)
MEIEYRAWITDYDYITNESKKYMVNVCSIHLGTKKVIVPWHGYGNYSLPFDKVKLMQYTRFKDDKGNKIYEGDVVRCYGGECYNGVWECDVIIFINDITNWEVMMRLSEIEHKHILGNIYNDPKLINEIDKLKDDDSPFEEEK